MEKVDRRIVPKEKAREAVESERSNGRILGDEETVTHLRRVLYPTYRVEYTYNTEEGIISTSIKNKRSVFLVDGFCKEINLTTRLQAFQSTASEPETVDGDYFSDSFVIRPLVDNEFAEEYLDERMQEVKHSTTRTAALSDKDGIASPWNGKPSEIRLREQLKLPDEFLFKNFVGVDNTSLVFLPFWVARYKDKNGSSRFLSFRDISNSRISGVSPDEVDWMTEYFSSTQKIRSLYLDESVDEVVLSRREQQVSNIGSGTQEHQNTSTDDSSEDLSYSRDEWVENPQKTSSEGDASPLGFQKVGGMRNLKEKLRKKIVEPMKNREKYQEFGLSVTNGVLLYGPPGTGKTYITRALAEELGYDFLEIEPSDIVSKWTGEAPKNIKKVFDDAVENQPCVVFIDEIDAIASARDEGEMNQSQKETVNQLLNELSRVQGEEVVVVGATNRIEQVDDALKRSGRFDERIEVPLPDKESREEIIQVHLRGKPTKLESLDWDEVTERTSGYTASDLELVVENAAQAALNRDKKITEEELIEAIKGTERSTKDMGKSSRYLQEVPEINFSNIGGMETLKRTLREKVINPLGSPEEYEEYGVGTVNGVLLHGPPGCGKTYISEALAGELGYNYLKIKPSDVTSKFVGEGANTVSEIFQVAKSNQPCVVFIDEIDAIASDRDDGNMTQSQRETVNQLLDELSEIQDEDVVVIAATNLLGRVDDAIRRSGRFDEKLEVPPPDRDARKEIAKIHLSDRPVSKELDWDLILEKTEGYTASDIELVAENAAREALKEDSSISTEHLVRAAENTQSSLRN